MSRKIVIFGDSYSTYEGYIPDGYPFYYSLDGRPDTPVCKMKVQDTWWARFIENTGANLVLNNSWSGSTVGYTGYDNIDCSRSSSFIYRFRQLVVRGFFKENKVDTVLVFGGTNDSWSNAPLGDMKLSDWEENDLYYVLPAFCYFMSALKAELPEAEIYFLINTDMKREIGECIKRAGEYFNVGVVEFKDIDKECGHPTVKGMSAICNQLLNKIK